MWTSKCPAGLFLIPPVRANCNGWQCEFAILWYTYTICRKTTDSLILFLGQISATAMRTATTRAKTGTSKMVRTPARFPQLQRMERTMRRAQLRGTPLVTVILLAETAIAAPGLRKARQTRGRAPSQLSPVLPALEKTSRAQTWNSQKRTSADQ